MRQGTRQGQFFSVALAICSLVASAAGCGSGDSGGLPAADAALVGEYNLANVNGRVLPFTLPASAGQATSVIAVASGRIQLNSDRSFVDERSLTVVPYYGASFAQTETRSGTWRAVDEGNVELSYTDPTPAVVERAQIYGTLLAKTASGAAYLYSR